MRALKQRRAKIVCTIGPSSISRPVLSSLIRDGMDVARLNFSHNSHAFHRKTVSRIRSLAKKLDRTVTILQDLQGIKIRVGVVAGGAVSLKTGSHILVSSGDGLSTSDHLFVSYPLIVRDARNADRILLDDGLIQLVVEGKTAGGLRARIVEGGILRDKKGVNLPGMKISQQPFTEKDRRDLELGISLGVDYAAVSFVRSADDLEIIKRWLGRRKASLPLIAKIEKPEALDNFDDILDAADGIMIARGDLGVEVAPEKVPIIQKALIERANRKGKLVITATQMLESMKEHLRPTRAEATDVANAVIDGTDALMLSAETAAGAHPREAFRMMDRIIQVTEESQKTVSAFERGSRYAEALAEAACGAAEDIRARVLVAFTRSGFTAQLVSKFRPAVPVVAYTDDRSVVARLNLFWGVLPRLLPSLKDTAHMIRAVERSLLADRLARRGDRLVIIACSPFATEAKTNFMKLHQIGD